MIRTGALAALAAALFAAGCGEGGEPDPQGSVPPPPEEAEHTLHWDLRDGPALEDFDWPNDTTAFQWTGGVDVELMLPQEKTFEERVHIVMGRRNDERLERLDLDFPPASTEDAYAHAQVLAEEWDIDLANIDAWYERRMAQREAGEEDIYDTAFTGTPHSEPIGEGGPQPAIEMASVLEEDTPVVVSFAFVWPRE